MADLTYTNDAQSKQTAESLITQNIDIWTTAIEQKSSAGRGISNKFSLYGIKKLRELILELAVRGKLVPQDVNDEPASVLLERIAAEKAQLVKAKKIKKPKALPEISENEKPFELKRGWTCVRLGSIGNIFNGNSVNARLKEDKYTGLSEGLPFIATKDVGYGFEALDYKNGVLIPFGEPKFKVAQKNSVLICAEGGSAGKKCGIALQDICFGNKLFAIELYGYIEPKFILSTYLTPSFFQQFSESMTGIIGGISAAKFSEIIIVLPPLEEQHRIVAKVDELMSLCDALEAQTEASISAHQTLVETLLNALLQPNTSQAVNSQTASQATRVNNTANIKDLHATSLENAGDNRLKPQLASSQEHSFTQNLTDSFAENWQRVAEHFDTLFTTEASIDTLKQTILQLAVMGKLVPQDDNDESATKLLERIAAEKAQLIKDGKIKKQKPLPAITDEEKPFELPKGWVSCRMGQVINLVSGQHLKPNEYSEESLENGVPYITGPAEFGAQFPTYSKYTTEFRALAKKNDILITCKGAGLGKLNRANITIAISRQLMAIQSIKGNLDFLFILVDSQYLYFQEKGVGIAIPGISRSDVEDLVLMLPPLEEQNRIVAKVDELMALCDQLKARLGDAQVTQLHLTDAIVEQVTGNVINNNKNEIQEEVPMKIITPLTTTSEFHGQSEALLAGIIRTLDDADAKSVWSKSGLTLPEFYKQLKKEIDAGFVNLPSKADFL